MELTHKWKARSPVDGLPVTMRRADFKSQQEQIGFLRQMVTAYRSLHTISALARDVIFRQFNLAPKRKMDHALALATWVQQRITYCNEGEETFQTPLTTLRLGYGDCDDHTTLVASLVESVGIPCQLVAVAWATPVQAFGRWALKLGPRTFRHIFPRAVIAGPRGARLVPLDTTLDSPVEYQTDPVALAAGRGLRPTTLVL